MSKLSNYTVSALLGFRTLCQEYMPRQVSVLHKNRNVQGAEELIIKTRKRISDLSQLERDLDVELKLRLESLIKAL